MELLGLELRIQTLGVKDDPVAENTYWSCKGPWLGPTTHTELTTLYKSSCRDLLLSLAFVCIACTWCTHVGQTLLTAKVKVNY